MTSHTILRGMLTTTLAVAGIESALASGGGQQLVLTIQGVSQVLGVAWRTEGNSILQLDSDIKQGVNTAVDFASQPYPPQSDDKAFYTRSDIDASMGGAAANLQAFRLYCGKKEGESSRTTTLVFWSQDYWEGTNQTFSCGGSNSGTFETAGTLTGSPRSFCLVTNLTSSARRSRCLSGPRCDDDRQNGNESDTDCGGSCSKCQAGNRCGSSSDCSSGVCTGGTCRQPSCSDNVRNGNESDRDCGGSCPDCSNGRSCGGNSDCQSNYCTGGTCQPKPTCKPGTPDNGSAQNWVVLVEDAWSCGHTYTAFANSLSDAKSCASAAGYTPISQLCGYYVRMQSSPNWDAYIEAASTSKAVTCAKNALCSNCSPFVVQTVGCATQ